jgi:hypothetical protein
MAKAPAPKEDPKDLVPQSPGAVPSFLAAKVQEHAGEGVSNAASDNLVPLVYIIHAMSARCNPKSPEYVENGTVGSIWLRNSGLPAIDGDEGIKVQPCHFGITWTEWIYPPKFDGSGFVAQHNERPAEAVEKPDPQDPERKLWLMPSGHVVRETRNHVVRVHLPNGSTMPYVIAMTGGNHTPSRGWMTMMSSKVVGGSQAPSYANFYRLKTKDKAFAKGTVPIWTVTDEGWVQTPEDFEAGAKLYEAFASGEKQMEVPADDLEPASGDNAAM